MDNQLIHCVIVSYVFLQINFTVFKHRCHFKRAFVCISTIFGI